MRIGSEFTEELTRPESCVYTCNKKVSVRIFNWNGWGIGNRWRSIFIDDNGKLYDFDDDNAFNADWDNDSDGSNDDDMNNDDDADDNDYD